MNDIEVGELENEIDSLRFAHDFWSIPKENRIFYLLCAYDASYVIRNELESKIMNISLLQNNKMYEYGLIQATEWSWSDDIHNEFCKINSVDIDKAGFFLQFCAEYCGIARNFQLYWKRLAQFSRENNTITIDYSEIPAERKVFGYFERALCILRKSKDQSEHDGPNLLIVDYFLKNGFIYFANVSDLLKNDVVKLFGVGPSYNEIMLDDDVDLSGFTAGQLRTFGMVLKIWSRVALFVYMQLFEQGILQENCFPTQIYDYNIFVKKICKATRLSVKTVNSIITRLSVNNFKKKDLIMAPFVVNRKQIAWSCLAMLESDLERNVLKNMCRTSLYKDIAASLVGRNESKLIEAVVSRINGGNNYSEIIVQKKIKKKKLEGEIDIMMFNCEFPNEILLIECKTFLSADELLEIENCTNVMKDGQEQLIRVERILNAMDVNEKHGISNMIDWNNINIFYKVVVTPDTHPSQRYENDLIPYTTLETIKSYYTDLDFMSPSSFFSASKLKPWLAGYFVSETTCVESCIGKYTFMIPKNKVLKDVE